VFAPAPASHSKAETCEIPLESLHGSSPLRSLVHVWHARPERKKHASIMLQCPAAPVCVELGKRIRSRRKRKGWTQVEMAAYLGTNRGHLSDLEMGKREIGLLMLQVIARGLDTTMAELLKGL